LRFQQAYLVITRLKNNEKDYAAIDSRTSIKGISDDVVCLLGLQTAIKVVKSENWKNLKMSAYYKCRDKLAVSENVTHKLCIPVLLQERAIQLAHQGQRCVKQLKKS
jgi:hypothetical protein